jgi:hypothetical protein
MKKKIDWVKVASIAGMVLGAVGTVISSLADEKKNERMIAEQVEEKVKLYFEKSQDLHSM